jgi:alginate O-acetyltransferase complex protein AlgI
VRQRLSTEGAAGRRGQSMLFNSYLFILLFLPATFAVFHFFDSRGRRRPAMAVLAIASLIFYGWWSLRGLVLLLVLMAANYAIVFALLRLSLARTWIRRGLVTFGIGANLAVLGYFKYANFFLENWAAIQGNTPEFLAVILPLGLSFFTFQKIALIADAYRGEVRDFEPLGYLLFVSFFPQLIAGPIVHHREVMPQFANPKAVSSLSISKGLMLFVTGLAKKVLLADTLAQYASPVFDGAGVGSVPGWSDAWIAALAFTLQLYFDFSGYSDMAIGLALLFGIRLPINFDSPYKATSIIDFWRRWHITLSRFLRDYLYVPLGGNRHGQARRYLNLLLTMLLGGLWHGAAWTFVVWGALHGMYLAVNHAWLQLRQRTRWPVGPIASAPLLGSAVTFLAVVFAWVFFRAADLGTAFIMLKAMAGLTETAMRATSDTGVILISASLLIVWFAPNSMQIMAYAHRESAGGLGPLPARLWAPAFGVVFALCLMSLTRVSEFLYFQF